MRARAVPASLAVLCAVHLLCAPSVSAGPWTRDQGHFYVNASYSRIAADKIYTPDFQIVPIKRYTQQVFGFYGEVGLATRWLTATLDGTLVRWNDIEELGHTVGVGDFRLGFWSGIVTRPIRLAVGLTFGLPLGDPSPRAGPGADEVARETARSLPTGDGEGDVELRLSLGHSFGRARRWPFEHYLVVEAGYWLRTAFADSFVYRVELGTRFPWRFINRFWLIARLTGVESFASNEEATLNPTGLSNGVTFLAPGFEVFARVLKGLGVSVALDGALRGRSVAAGRQLKVTMSWEY